MLGVHNDNAPSNIIEIFARFSNNHIYTTRSEKSELFSVKLSLKFREAYLPVSVKIWNEIPT